MRSQEEITHLAARWLQRQHGDRVAVQFHEMSSEHTQQAFPAIVDTVLREGWPLPVVEIDNGLTPLPFVSYWAIVDVVESALSKQAQPIQSTSPQ